MGKKIMLPHREVEVKILLEVLAVYAVLALALVGIYYIEPAITSFAAIEKQVDYVDDVNFAAQASLENSGGTASYLFEAGDIAEEKIVLLLLFAIGAYSCFFVGVFIYKKRFSINAPKRFEALEKPLAKEKKGIPIIGSIVNSFGNAAKRVQRAKDEGAKKKLELEKQRLMLKGGKGKVKLELQGRKAKFSEEEELEKERELELNKDLREERKKEREAEGLRKQKEKERIQIKRILADKSRLFKKCYKLMLKANDALQKNYFGRAKKIYLKSRELYIKLEYHERKEIYNALNALYDVLKK